MLNRFETAYSKDSDLSSRPTDISYDEKLMLPDVKELLLTYGGTSFNNGIYRVLSPNSINTTREFIVQAFPDFSKRSCAFGYDWLGRLFALDMNRLEQGMPAVVMMDPGAAEVLEIPCNLVAFHENEIVDYSDEALAVTFYNEWLSSGGVAPAHSQCIGYKRPLFLGGRDDIDNLEVSDIDVYWSLSAQIIEKMDSVALLPG